MQKEGSLSVIDGGMSFFSLSRNIADSDNLENACQVYEEYLKQYGLSLLSVKFCDVEGEHPALRPFAGYPNAISKLSGELRDIGGCPITKEAIKQLAPFDAVQINSRDYTDFLSARFLAELKKMDHHHIAVVPLLVGTGIDADNRRPWAKRFFG